MEDLKFTNFKNHVLTTKHSVWFEYHSVYKQRMIYDNWLNAIYTLRNANKTPSLRKFLYNIRQDTRFSVPKQALRDNILKEILV